MNNTKITTIKFTRFFAAITIATAFAYTWFTRDLLLGFIILSGGIFLYAFNVYSAFNLLSKYGLQRFQELILLDREILYSKHSQEFENILSLYNIVHDIESRLPEPKFKTFIDNAKKINEYQENKNNWILKNSSKETA